MLDQLRAMAVFAKTVETGSFRGAAQALGLSPSVVSHHVAQLESALEVMLLHRSTRRIALTEDGRRVYEAARDMLSAAESGLQGLAAGAENPSGSLSITAPAALAAGTLIDDLAAFALAFPRVAMTMSFSDTPLDLIESGIDVAIRGGKLEDSSLKSKKLFDIPRKLIASPEYFAKQPPAKTPHDLIGWDWIRLKSRPPRASFVGPGGREVEIELSARLAVDDAQAMLALSRRGLGLCIVPAALAAPDLADRQMIEVLPEWHLDVPAVYALWPAHAPRAGLASRFVAFLEERQKARSLHAAR